MGTFHWTSTGDALWFNSWVPDSEGAYIGCCIALFILAILARGSTALQYYFEAWLIMKEEKRLHAMQQRDSEYDMASGTVTPSVNETIDSLRRREPSNGEKSPEYEANSSPLATMRTKSQPPRRPQLPHVPAFHWRTDTLRSFLTTLITFISYLLMLVVMTGNGAYFICIIAGVFVGEMIFGRYRGLRGFHDDHFH
ncbi:hypothetical protein VKS41_001569 [Umbelopsis sp. WA50703]